MRKTGTIAVALVATTGLFGGTAQAADTRNPLAAPLWTSPSNQTA